MYIKKLVIISFGCFENKTLEFENGFNLIYGNNESGKSTILAFIVFMFYSAKLKKLPGELTFKEKYMPWSGKAMHGRVIFEHKQHTYVLERLLSDTRSMEKIYCLDTGEEITDRDVLSCPGEYFFGVGAQAFFASAFYSGEKSSYHSSGQEFVTKLSGEHESGADEVSYNTALDIINDEILSLTSPRRKDAKIPALEKIVRTKKDELFMIRAKSGEADDLQKENAQLKEKIQKLKNDIRTLKNLSSESQKSEKGFSVLQNFMIAFIVICLVSLTLYIAIETRFTIAGISACLIVCIFTVAMFIMYKRSRKASFHTKIFTIQRNNDKILMLTEQVSSLEIIVARNEERINSVLTDSVHMQNIDAEIASAESELSALKREVEALELAKLALGNAYAVYKENFTPWLSRTLGSVVSNLTCGKYSCVMVDDSFKMRVEGEYGYKNTDSLSQGTVHQAGLGIHISLAETLLTQNRTPLFMDDALAFYDEHRAKSAMEYIYSLSAERQIFFSTCRKGEVEVLKDKNINFLNLTQ